MLDKFCTSNSISKCKMHKLMLPIIVIFLSSCSMPDFMVQGQLDDFEKAIESGDVDWIVEQHTDDIVRKNA